MKKAMWKSNQEPHMGTLEELTRSTAQVEESYDETQKAYRKRTKTDETKM